MKKAPTIAHDNAPSLTPLVTLLADDLEQVNEQIVMRMASDVPLVPELAGHLIAAGGNQMPGQFRHQRYVTRHPHHNLLIHLFQIIGQQCHKWCQ